MKSKISILTIILIFLALLFLFFTFNSYSYYKYQSKSYSDMLYAEPTESVISDEDRTYLYENELNKYVLLKNSEMFTQILEGDRMDMLLSYSNYARNLYNLNRLAFVIFTILSIFSWKMDKLKKKN